MSLPQHMFSNLCLPIEMLDLSQVQVILHTPLIPIVELRPALASLLVIPYASIELEEGDSGHI